jgi:hypothetical protein
MDDTYIHTSVTATACPRRISVIKEKLHCIGLSGEKGMRGGGGMGEEIICN